MMDTMTAPRPLSDLDTTVLYDVAREAANGRLGDLVAATRAATDEAEKARLTAARRALLAERNSLDPDDRPALVDAAARWSGRPAE